MNRRNFPASNANELLPTACPNHPAPVGGLVFLALAIALLGCSRATNVSIVEDHRTTDVASWTISAAEKAVVLSESGDVAFSASLPEQALVANETVSVLVEAKIAPGFHLYGDLSSPSPFTPLSIEASTDDGSLAIERVSIPEASATADGKPIYRNSLVTSVLLRLSELHAAKYRLTIKCQFQACNDLVCLPPDTSVIELPIVVSQSTSLSKGAQP